MRRIDSYFRCGETQAKGSAEPMHIFIFTYTILHARKNAVTTVVVLAVVRPPPVRVYHIFLSPVGEGS